MFGIKCLFKFFFGEKTFLEICLNRKIKVYLFLFLSNCTNYYCEKKKLTKLSGYFRNALTSYFSWKWTDVKVWRRLCLCNWVVSSPLDISLTSELRPFSSRKREEWAVLIFLSLLLSWLFPPLLISLLRKGDTLMAVGRFFRDCVNPFLRIDKGKEGKKKTKEKKRRAKIDAISCHSWMVGC